MNNVREQVLETIIDVIRDAENQGRDHLKTVMQTFPGIPETVFWEAWAEFDRRLTDQWWQQVERTIDGEVIRTALLRQSVVTPETVAAPVETVDASCGDIAPTELPLLRL